MRESMGLEQAHGRNESEGLPLRGLSGDPSSFLRRGRTRDPSYPARRLGGV